MPTPSHRSPLLLHIQYLAKQRVKRRATFAGTERPYNRWLWLVASELGLNYGRLLGECELMAKYYAYNVQNGFWKQPLTLFYKPDVFQRQLDTLLEAVKISQPLARIAARRGVSFKNFEFGVSLLDVVVWLTARMPVFDFTALVAPGSVITQSWAICCSRYAGSDLEECKFVDVFCDPAVGPGSNIYRGDFQSANLAGADFRRAYLRGSDFRGANLIGADFRATQYLECKFEGASVDDQPCAFTDTRDVHTWLVKG